MKTLKEIKTLLKQHKDELRKNIGRRILQEVADSYEKKGRDCCMVLQLVLIILIGVLLQGCAEPIPRKGGAFDGSAKWALNIAQPLINTFAADAKIYCVIGENIHKDGRLYQNMGTWSFLTWSLSQQKVFEATVKHDGTVSNTTRNEVSPIAPSDGQAIPPGWIDSTDIFAIIAPYLASGVKHADLAVLNVGNNPQALDQAVWSINFSKGKRHLVKSDGTPVGIHPDTYYLLSPFLKREPNIHRIMNGMPYNMDAPTWFINVSDQNRDVYAYKFLAVFHMLGYNTEIGMVGSKPHLLLLHKFQGEHGLLVGNLVTADVLRKLDPLLFKREIYILAVLAMKPFPLYDHMQPLHYHDVSRGHLAMIYHLPMTVLPGYLQMSDYETVQCIGGQCLGLIQDASGNDWPTYPVDVTKDYRFVGAYFDPKKANVRLPSAAVFIGAVLHEYAHYLDGQLYQIPVPGLPLHGAIKAHGFYDISYDMSKDLNGCTPRRSNNPKDWITKYAFAGSYTFCPAGTANITEEFAETFSMYVADGKHFRAATTQNATIAKKYDWLKTNVFQGREYDTDLQRSLESGCNDVPGYEQAQPGYASCSEGYVWDGELRIK